MTRRRLAVVVCLMALTVFAAPVHAQSHERTIRDTVSAPSGHLAVENEEGSISVSTWERDAVAYRVRVVSRQAEDIVNDTEIVVDSTGDRLLLGADYSEIEMQWRFGPEMYGYGKTHPVVHVTLQVPPSLSVAMDAEKSQIHTQRLEGALRIEGEGDVAATNLITELLSLESHTEGPQHTVEGHRGPLRLNLEEGRTKVGIDSLKETEVSTEEGIIELIIPRNTGFVLSADLGTEATLQSPLDVGSLRDENGNLHGTIGDGGPLVHIASEEGEIILRTQ